MNLVVAGKQKAIGAHQFGAVVGEAFPCRHREAAAQKGYLITAGHRYEKTAATLGKAGGQL